MNTKEQLEEKLLAYIDGTLPATERDAFEKILFNDASLKQKVVELKAVDAMMKRARPQHPSDDFTQRVMRNLHHYPMQGKPVFLNGIIVFIGVLILVALCTALVYYGMFDAAIANVDLNGNEVVNKYLHKTLPRFSIDGRLIINAVILLNLVLALIVFDKAVLKPVFQRRLETEA
jgi:anti-sigma factor RsiW